MLDRHVNGLVVVSHPGARFETNDELVLERIVGTATCFIKVGFRCPAPDTTSDAKRYIQSGMAPIRALANPVSGERALASILPQIVLENPPRLGPSGADIQNQERNLSLRGESVCSTSLSTTQHRKNLCAPCGVLVIVQLGQSARGSLIVAHHSEG